MGLEPGPFPWLWGLCPPQPCCQKCRGTLGWGLNPRDSWLPYSLGRPGPCMRSGGKRNVPVVLDLPWAPGAPLRQQIPRRGVGDSDGPLPTQQLRPRPGLHECVLGLEAEPQVRTGVPITLPTSAQRGHWCHSWRGAGRWLGGQRWLENMGLSEDGQGQEKVQCSRVGFWTV